MFDYVSDREIRLLCKLRVPGDEPYLSSSHRMRLELLGLITDGPNGIQLTAKGLRVAAADYPSEEWRKFEPQIIRLQH